MKAGSRRSRRGKTVRPADDIRDYVIQEWIEPARKAGFRQAIVRAGDVHEAMGLQNRMPAVCAALDAAEFGERAGVTLITRSGPRQGADAEWVFAL